MNVVKSMTAEQALQHAIDNEGLVVSEQTYEAMKNHPVVQERTKRQEGFYWVRFSQELQNSSFTSEWVIANWDGFYFWVHGDDYSAEYFSEIDETPITRPEADA